jgi:hypothetical protein
MRSGRRRRLQREKKAAKKELARQKNLDRYGKQAEAKWTQAMSLPPETQAEWAHRELTLEVERRRGARAP